MQITNDYILKQMFSVVKKQGEQLWEVEKKDVNLFQIKQKFPSWLQKLLFSSYNPVYSIWKFRKVENTYKNSSRHRFCIDFLGYCYSHDFCFDIEEYYDEDSIKDVENFINSRIENFLGIRNLKMSQSEYNKIKKQEQKLHKRIKYKEGFYQYKNDTNTYYLPLKKFDYNVFIAKYGINKLPSHVIETVKGSVCIDVGAYIGDTCLLLQEYLPKEICAYEPVNRDYQYLLKTIEKNGLTNIVTPVKKGLGNEKMYEEISVSGFSSSIISDFHGSEAIETIEITTIDDEFQNKKVGLIKMDVEGFEYNVILGALDVIKRDKPIILISIYHTGKDFFEIVPLLKKCCPEYKFKYIDTYPISAITEKIVIAYI